VEVAEGEEVTSGAREEEEGKGKGMSEEEAVALEAEEEEEGKKERAEVVLPERFLGERSAERLPEAPSPRRADSRIACER
jgi:hypothetical protein